MFDRQLFRQFYIATLAAVAFFLPLSVWLVSVFILMNFLVWIFGGGLKRLSEGNNRNFYVYIFSGIYIIHILWMINTSNRNSGLMQLWQKLPFIMLPLSIGLSDPLNKKEMKTTLSFFVGGVMFSSVIGIVTYLLDREVINIDDPRKISLFIPYIRLSMESNLSVIISVWYLFTEKSKLLKVFYFISAIWLILFLFLLLSITGILIFSIIVVVSVFILLKKSYGRFLKIGFVILFATCFVLAGLYISNEIRNFYNKCNKYTYPLQDKTLNGNSYTHFPERRDIENGNPVWIYISEPEMRKEWNLRSNINYDSTDLRNQKLNVTLIRYLTSAGLTKDSAGISQLKDQDIKYVESGITNQLFTQGKPIKAKIYEIIWQIDYYRNGGNSSGHSVTQRIEFFKTGFNLLKRNLIFGTGTGDLKDEMTSQYERDKSKLDATYRFLPHNQYLNSLLTFGIFGFLLICLSVLLPVVKMKTYQNFLFNLFFLIILLSMFGEDIMETHTGVCFFTYFYTLFVFGEEKNE